MVSFEINSGDVMTLTDNETHDWLERYKAQNAYVSRKHFGFNNSGPLTTSTTSVLGCKIFFITTQSLKVSYEKHVFVIACVSHNRSE